MDVETFVLELRALPYSEAIQRAREAARNPEHQPTLMPHPAFQAWVLEMDRTGHID